MYYTECSDFKSASQLAKKVASMFGTSIKVKRFSSGWIVEISEEIFNKIQREKKEKEIPTIQELEREIVQQIGASDYSDGDTDYYEVDYSGAKFGCDPFDESITDVHDNLCSIARSDEEGWCYSD